MSVTLLEHADLKQPMRIQNTTILEPGSPVVWFTFPGLWHDIGRFHLRDGTFTGLYANLLTPVEFVDATTWHTTDLCLDVWLSRQGTLAILDGDELAAAEARGEIAAELATQARAEAARIEREWRAGNWPPALVEEWTLERGRTLVETPTPGRPPRGPPPASAHRHRAGP